MTPPAEPQPLYLVTGDLVLALPVGEKLAQELAARGGGTVELVRRPPALDQLLSDLRTFSLFGAPKVVLAIETAVLADRGSAAALITQALETPLREDAGELGAEEKAAARRLLQVLRMFDRDPYTGSPEEAVASLPDWVVAGAEGKGKQRNKGGKLDERRAALRRLLERARTAGLQGFAETDAVDLAEVVRRGLPAGHALILVESTITEDHPVVIQLRERQAVIEAGSVRADGRGHFEGLLLLQRELERETGIRIGDDALRELARRTLRTEGRSNATSADSTARFAAEYRKLATLAGERIDRDHVLSAVTDRGDEDVWQLLDAVAEGRGGEALPRLRRMVLAAEEPEAARLVFFAMISDFGRSVALVQALLRAQGLALGERNYNRFKAALAPKLQAPFDSGLPNPLARLHPFRLHRLYLMASRLRGTDLARLHWRLLETELRLKGESGEPDAALAHLVATLARPAASGGAASGAGGAGPARSGGSGA